ncbi:hypothetical protein [Maribacter sp. HTCC2170]|uniref:hypothetical protein n=1 Tax=Maribacter sp. (strain HTCC2170 / KCCM 42371) TaxID=313603 RepID=UPI00006B47FB|nr:hypothetical protein [Maribacter sp. HTCC2170]EAR01935.1 hypothetical protein FB2170_15443 [Maribacter sp. HTCC2170]
MKKLSSTLLPLLFFSVFISAQVNSPLDMDEESQNNLFTKDWSSLDDLITGKPKIVLNDNLLGLNLRPDINFNDLMVNETRSDIETNVKAIEMPIHEPYGNYKMRVIKNDSTSRFYLKIFADK